MNALDRRLMWLPCLLYNSPCIAAVEVAVLEDGDEALVKVMQVPPMRAFLLLAAFSFHTVFDGLAVGLQQNQENIWQVECNFIPLIWPSCGLLISIYYFTFIGNVYLTYFSKYTLNFNFKVKLYYQYATPDWIDLCMMKWTWIVIHLY